MEFKRILKAKEYDFIKTNENLGKNVILLGIGGSYSYGTNNENSDIDIRGVALNKKTDLIGMTQFEQYVDKQTDTTIYSFHKMIRLLLNCNPNTIELLGLKKDHYLYLNQVGEDLIKNRSLFLSKRAIRSFGGYADQQLRRLQNALARDSYPQIEKEKHIYNSMKNALYDFKKRYEKFEDGSLKLFIDKARNEELEAEIFMDVNLKHYPLRDYKNIYSEMNNIIRDYDKIGKRNKKKDNNHLNKHAMHLIRLFMMAIDILEKGEIHTFREKEQPLLLDIRKGIYQKEDGTFREEFYELLSDYENRLSYAAEHTILPEEPNIEAIQEFMMNVNEGVIGEN